jgi:hypothetical protein
MKNAVFWDVASCGSCENRRFGENVRLHLQDRENPRAKKNVISILSSC